MLRIYHFIALCMLPQVLAKRDKILTVTSENWRDILEGEWMIKFYAPWCPACRTMADDYKRFAEWSDDLKIKVAEVNINEETGLSGRFIVTALPTIYHGKDGEFRRYAGQRESNSLHRYVEDKLWRGTDPVAWYRHPDAVTMTLMSYLFQTSMVIKVFHETLTEKFGFSSTTAYVLFGIATVVTGLLLGLVLVVIIECVAPQRPKDKESQASKKISDSQKDSANDESADSSQESLSGGENESKDVSSASEDEIPESQKSSSSQISQEWEKIIRDEDECVEDSQVSDEKPQEKEEGQGELRRRKVDKETAQE